MYYVYVCIKYYFKKITELIYMETLSGICFSCMRPLDAYGRCPHCGDAALPVQESPLLTRGTTVNNRYFIGKVVKSNGEGSTYVAYDMKLSRPCTIREFYPSAIASRGDDGVTVLPAVGSHTAYEMCLDAFLKLWTKLFRLKGLTALISVYDVFQANSTAYAVYSDSEEKTLRTFLLSNGTGYLPWEQARILFMPVLSTLATLHTSGVVHRGIDPSALIMTPDGKLKLTDFCTANVKTAYGELEADISDGYAPLEVYSNANETGPWSDIYSFTAVLFRTLVGSTPIAAPVRAKNDQMMIPAKFAEQLPPHVINALINGMQLDEKERTHNAEQLRSNLSASPRAIGASAEIFSQNTLELNARASQQRVREHTSLASREVEPPVRQTTTPRPRPDDPLTPERIQRAKEAEAAANKKVKTQKTLKILLIVIFVMLLIGIGLVVSELLKGGGSTPPTTEPSQVTEAQTAVVEDFRGQMYDYVTSHSYYSSMFTFATVTQPSDTVPRGQIIAQNVPANTVVAKGTCITLTVSTGPDVFALPDVANGTYEEALAALSSRGLICVRNVKYNDGTHPADKVAETVPEAGSQVKSGDTVYIVMWGGSDETTLPGETLPGETLPGETQPTAPAVTETTLPTP